jgi:two-component system KDP operon response regulator KdpE
MSPLTPFSYDQLLGKGTTLSPGRVLVVDDDPPIRRVLKTTLTSAGYMVIDAMTGEEALEKLQVGLTVDAILLDLKMPGMGGLEACRRIREIADTPILVISILREPEDRMQALAAGADDYLAKPFGIYELLARIRTLRKAVALESVVRV